ncbi:hypothetical protein [Winogradskyella sp. R77965]|uniref:hypothetical protein n=1 Tax=Winogradskyella sp. R77965 TaxID=3093872 RepID=UPI0037DD38DF
MKDDNTERLIKKYKEGQSTLNEEQLLFESTENLEPSIDAWSTFVKHNKKEIPEDFNAQLWQSFEKRTNKKRKVFVGILSAAASVVLLVSLFLFNQNHDEMSYAEKETLLNLARDMVYNTDSAEVEERIVYENDIVIIYTTKEE